MRRSLFAALLVLLAAPQIAHAAGADAALIVFSSNRADGVRELYTVDRDGSGEHRITFNDVVERQPVFSPDGNRIAFAGLRDGIWDIYTIDAEGDERPRRLTSNGAINHRPSWSPDGRLIAFDSETGGQTDVFVAPWTGGEQQPLITGPGDQDSPSWGTAP